MPDERKSLNSNERFPIDNVLQLRDTHFAMKQRTVSFRATSEDAKIIDRMATKLGIKTSQVIKIALRRLAEAEGMKLKAS